jgi:methionyl-tRNA formyltransferase
MPLRVAFFGTPGFAVPTLAAIARSAHTLVGVVTQPDRARGRGQKIQFGAVKTAALAEGVPILQPERLRDESFLAAFDALRCDVAVVAAYGKLLPQLLLDRPRLGLINVHASLLPRWRGAAPIHRAMLAGDEETGVTIMRVVLALDAGPMLARTRVPIDPNETSVSLEARLAAVGAPMTVESLDALEHGRAIEEPQDVSLATYATRLERADSRVDWQRTSRQIHDQIRGLHPWPLAEAYLGALRLRLVASARPAPAPARRAEPPGTIVAASRTSLVVATGDAVVELTRVQPEGRPVMAVGDFINGHPVTVGMSLTASASA